MKRIVVTGANKGIGLAIVRRLLSEYDETFLILAARSLERGEQAVSLLLNENEAWKDRLITLKLDVEHDDSTAEASEKIQSVFNGITEPIYCLINNAGVGDSYFGMRRVLDINTWGVQRVCEAFLPMVCKNNGRIVNVTSASGPNFVEKSDATSKYTLTNPNVTWSEIEVFLYECLIKNIKEPASISPYGLSKACTNALTIHLARENKNLIINACSPGWIVTDLTKNYVESTGKTPAEIGMKTPFEGALSSVYLSMGEDIGTGMYFGSDCLRSPLDRYRSPGTPAYVPE
jgi:NAD(P)-dependent dehydrogenase (short-subunit alcohol dehydrogenase family)